MAAGDARVISVGSAGSLPSETKEVADTFLYTFDFTGWLDTGETVSTATGAVSPSGPTVGSPTVSGGTLVKTLISGGTSGVKYTVTITANITSSQVKTTKMSLYIL